MSALQDARAAAGIARGLASQLQSRQAVLVDYASAPQTRVAVEALCDAVEFLAEGIEQLALEVIKLKKGSET